MDIERSFGPTNSAIVAVGTVLSNIAVVAIAFAFE
jgi:hypothetical protein